MSTQTKDSLKKSLIIYSLKTFIKEKFIKKITTFLFPCVVKITAICNNALRPPHKGPPHTVIHFFMNSFIKNKTKRIQRKTYDPVPPNVRPCRMLGGASFFHSRLHPSQYGSYMAQLYGIVEKQRESRYLKKSKDSVEQNLPN